MTAAFRPIGERPTLSGSVMGQRGTPFAMSWPRVALVHGRRHLEKGEIYSNGQSRGRVFFVPLGSSRVVVVVAGCEFASVLVV